VSPEFVADMRTAGQRIFAGGLGGLVCGFLVGGLGGRLAMFFLRLTSGPEVIGIVSDDGFTIGSFTGSTMFLLAITSMTGAMLGVVYVALRQTLPARYRALVIGAVLSLVVGAAIVEPEGVDFTVLRPRWLAIVLFVLLPGVFGFALSKVVDALVERPVRHGLPWVAIAAAVVVLGLIGTEGGGSLGLALGIVALFLLGWLASTRFPRLRRIPSSAPALWLARAALLAAGVAGAVALARDVGEIL
jgi:hypothetical protein